MSLKLSESELSGQEDVVILTTVVGVSFRQTAISEFLKSSKRYLTLAFVDDNPYDENAVEVWGVDLDFSPSRWHHLGYLPREIAPQIRQLASVMSHDIKCVGSGRHKPDVPIGLSIKITFLAYTKDKDGNLLE